MERALILAMAGVMVFPAGMAAKGAEDATGPSPDDELVLADATGDLWDPWAERTVKGPPFLDLTGMSVSVRGEDLHARFDVAGKVPPATEAGSQASESVTLGWSASRLAHSRSVAAVLKR